MRRDREARSADDHHLANTAGTHLAYLDDRAIAPNLDVADSGTQRLKIWGCERERDREQVDETNGSSTAHSGGGGDRGLFGWTKRGVDSAWKPSS